MEWIKVQVARDRRLSKHYGEVNGPEEAGKLLRRQSRKLDREHLWRVDLDARNRPMSLETVGIGTATSSLAHPREIFKGAIVVGAVSILIAHNHPSGALDPSAEDIRMTSRMAEAGELLGIPLLDHLILGFGNKMSSLRSMKPELFKTHVGL